MPRRSYGPLNPYQDYQLQEEKLDDLYNAGSRGPGVLGELVSLFTMPQQMNAARHAQLAGAAEEYGPTLAKEKGISEDEARAQISENVRPVEPLYHRAGRAIGLPLQEPQGEPYQDRIARLAGMARRFEHEDTSRKAARERFRDLITIVQHSENPEDLTPQLQEAARDAGYGDLPAMKIRHDPGSLFEWAGEHGMSPERYFELTHPKPEPRAETPDQASERRWTSPDPRLRKLEKLKFRNRTATAKAPPKMPDDISDQAIEKQAHSEVQRRFKLIEEDTTLTPEQQDRLKKAVVKEVSRRTGVRFNLTRQRGGQGGHASPITPDADAAAPTPDAPAAPAADDSDAILDGLGVK